MSDHANAVNNSQVDMGLRVFLAGFFAPLAVAAVVGVVGFGLTGSSLVALVAVVSCLLLVGAANVLYAGYRGMEPVVMAGAGVLLALAVVVLFFMSDAAPNYYVAVELALPMVFAAVLATPMVRAFLATRRGETVAVREPVHKAPSPPVPAPAPVVPAPAPAASLSTAAEGKPAGLSDQVRKSAAAFSFLLRLFSGLLLLCAVGGIALVVVSIIGLSEKISLSFGGGFAVLLTSIAAVPPALVLMVLADYWGFLSTTRGHDKAHLANIVESSQHLVYCVGGALTLVVLLALFNFLAG